MKAFARIIGALLVVVLLIGGMTVSAAEPYRPYQYNSYSESVPSVAGYTVAETYNATAIGVDDLETPSDLFCSGDKVYLLDAGNARVLILDKELRVQKILDRFVYGEEELTLKNPQGLFAEEGRLLIADTDNRRVLECDEEGRVIRMLTVTPEATEEGGYLSKLDFKPLKAVFSGKNDVYVIVQNCYYGILRFNLDGHFRGFYGSNMVEGTLGQKLDQLWKRLLTKEQQKYISNYVPSDYSSMAVDSEGFIYTSTSKNTGSKKEIQKLNTKGANILTGDNSADMLNKLDYGDKERIVYRKTSWDSKLIDIAVSKNGIIATLDQTKNRVFFYDQDSNLLFVVGGDGDQKGLFRLPVALDYLGEDVLVLDSDKKSITRLTPTQFGSYVLEATYYSALGQYDKAEAPWQKVLQMDANYEAAYRGIGKAQLANGDYEGALKNLRKGQDREAYSKAYKIVRNDALRNNFIWILVVIAALIALIVLRKRIAGLFKGRIRIPLGEEETPWYPMRHLINGFITLRKTKNPAVTVTAALLVVAWFFVSLFTRQYTGFIFNLEKPEMLNIFLILARTVGLFLLWWISSMCVSSLLSGEGRNQSLFVVSAYALTPMLITQLLYVILSNVATFDEESLLSLMTTVGIVWSAWLLFNGIREAHQFSGGRTLFCLFLTFAGMMIFALLLMLLSGLVQQLVTFVMTVINELVLRRM